MKRYYIATLVSMALGVLIRTVPVWAAVFTEVGVKYSTPDSYYHARGILVAIKGSPVSNIFDVYDHIAAALIKLSHIDPEIMMAVMPLAIFACTVPAVYLIARTLFDRRMAVVACFIFAVLPSEYMVRSLLGEPDHHAAEVFVATWALCIILLAVNMKRKLYRYGLLALVAVVGYCVISYMMPLLKGYIKFLFSGYAYMTTEVRGIFENPPAATYIIEALVTVGLLVLVLIKTKPRKPGLWVFALWTLAIVAMTVSQRRFDYYLTTELAVLCGFGITLVAKDIKLHWVAVMLFVVIITTPISYFQAQVANLRPSDEWVTNLRWLAARTDGRVLAWWDYGYWVKYYGMKPLIDGGQANVETIKKVADYYLTGEGELNVDYIIVDKVLVSAFIPVLESWADVESPEAGDTLAARLYSGEDIPGFTYLLGDTVKVFEVEK